MLRQGSRDGHSRWDDVLLQRRTTRTCDPLGRRRMRALQQVEEPRRLELGEVAPAEALERPRERLGVAGDVEAERVGRPLAPARVGREEHG